MKTKVPLTESAADSAIVMSLFWAAVTGLSSYVAAIFTTVFEFSGFWRYCWLTICLVLFITAYCCILLALRHFGSPPAAIETSGKTETGGTGGNDTAGRR
jgi:cytochrome bd-type quinol oxidase subunit 2